MRLYAAHLEIRSHAIFSRRVSTRAPTAPSAPVLWKRRVHPWTIGREVPGAWINSRGSTSVHLVISLYEFQFFLSFFFFRFVLCIQKELSLFRWKKWKKKKKWTTLEFRSRPRSWDNNVGRKGRSVVLLACSVSRLMNLHPDFKEGKVTLWLAGENTGGGSFIFILSFFLSFLHTYIHVYTVFLSFLFLSSHKGNGC